MTNYIDNNGVLLSASQNFALFASAYGSGYAARLAEDSKLGLHVARAFASAPNISAIDALHHSMQAAELSYSATNAAYMRTLFNSTGYALGLGIIAVNVLEAPPAQRNSEALKQLVLFEVGLAISTAILVPATVTAVGALAAPLLAMLVAGAVVSALDYYWDPIMNTISDGLSQAANSDLITSALESEFLSDLNAFLDEPGATAQNFLNNIVNDNHAADLIKILGNALSSMPNSGLTPILGLFTSAIANLTTPVATDPILIDLGGNGIELTSIDESSAYFDLHDTGFAVKTGWVGVNTGILVLPNLDGTVTGINNLFGNNSTDGFTAMRGIDSNNDGVLDANDSLFNDLRVWVDLDGDGDSDAGELKTLAELDIISINLSPIPTNQIVNGNIIAAYGHYTRSDNSTGQIAEAYFNNYQLSSQFNGTYTLNPQVLLLPNQRGYGTLPDLFIAMSLDSTLLVMVEGLTEISDMNDFNVAVRDVIYRWANVESVDPSGRGGAVDGQHLAVLEKVIGHAWTNTFNNGSNPISMRDVHALESAYAIFFDSVRNHLWAQTDWAQSIFAGIQYDYTSDAMIGDVDFAGAVGFFQDGEPNTTLADKGRYWIEAIKLIDYVAGEMGVSIHSYDAELQDVLSTAGLPSTLNAVHNLHFVEGVPDGNGNNIFDMTIHSIHGAIIEGLPTGLNVLRGVDSLADAVFTNMDVLELTGTELRITQSQFDSFESFVSATWSSSYIFAMDGGIYDLSSKTLTGAFGFSARYATGPVTFIAPDGDTTFIDSSPGYYGENVPVATMIGGAGNDTFYINQAKPGTVLVGGNGTDTLQIGVSGGSGVVDLTEMSISGIENLNLNGTGVKINADQLADFETFTTSGYSIGLAGNGTYDFSSKVFSDVAMINLSDSEGNVSVIGNDQDTYYMTPFAADNVSIVAGSGNDTFSLNDGSLVSLSIDGGGGDNTLMSTDDISNYSITNVSHLYLNGDVKLTANQLLSFTSLTGYWAATIKAASSGVYDLTGKNSGGTLRLSATETSDNVTLISGHGDSIFFDGAGDNTFIGGGGSNSYIFSSNFGNDQIENNASGNTPFGQINLSGASVDLSQIWFERLNDDLIIDVIGTTDSITVKDWYGGNNGAKVQELRVGWNYITDSGIESLVSAMASFAAVNPGFDPSQANAMPLDTALQNAITVNWQ